MIGLTSGTAEAIPPPAISDNAKPQEPAASLVINGILVHLPINSPTGTDEIQRSVAAVNASSLTSREKSFHSSVTAAASLAAGAVVRFSASHQPTQTLDGITQMFVC